MKKFMILAMATVVMTACNNQSYNITESESPEYTTYSYKVSPSPSIIVMDVVDEIYDYDTYEEVVEPEDIDRYDYYSACVSNTNNNYYINKVDLGNYTISDMEGNYTYVNVDDYGNVSVHDQNGNYYYSSTDDFGNTTGYDSEGNYYYSSTDDFGTTTTYDSNGNYSYTTIDDFGNISGYDSEGNSFYGYADDFGNVSITMY